MADVTNGFNHLEATSLTRTERELQEDVRDFLAAELVRGTFAPGLGMDTDSDPSFSKKLAERGWVGMSLSRRYGGSESSAVERFVVAEELLRWGAPVAYHWIADRQSGPLIERFGTEDQRRRFLPGICRGESAFCIGMSEADSGSDLASVRCRAERVPGGWEVSGSKLWTTGAHRSDWMIALVRTSVEEDRHRGLTQVLIDLRSSGISILPIETLDGRFEFNEVVFDHVLVSDDQVIGEIGGAWNQIGAELTLSAVARTAGFRRI